MSFTPSAAGKGDENRTKDFAAYRGALFWKRSACCNAHVRPVTGAAADLREALGDDPAFACCGCGKTCQLKP